MRRSWFLAAALAFPGLAGATDVDLALEVQGGGGNAIVVTPGATVNYQVVAQLTDNLNEGIASILFDLSFDGGPLVPGDEPTAAPMDNFARPKGITNPNGFGGTVVGGKLVQVGGAQNTIKNSFAPYPKGSVITGLGKPSTGPLVVFTGSLTAPIEVGTYTLSIENVDVNVIRQGEIGIPFWKVEKAGLGQITDLTVEVRALFGDVTTLSVSNPGTQTLSLDAGLPNATKSYWVLGSASGTSPGMTFANGTTMPLNFDAYTQFTVWMPNSSILQNSFGVLDGSGRATCLFNLPAGLPASVVGLTVNHAYALLPADYVSNPVAVTLTP